MQHNFQFWINAIFRKNSNLALVFAFRNANMTFYIQTLLIMTTFFTKLLGLNPTIFPNFTYCYLLRFCTIFKSIRRVLTSRDSAVFNPSWSLRAQCTTKLIQRYVKLSVFMNFPPTLYSTSEEYTHSNQSRTLFT